MGIYTSGFSVCSNGTLAIGDSAIFYQCLSGTFCNLYDESTGAQCSPIYINILDTGAAASSGAATQISDGQIQAPTSTAKPVTQISDGQIQAPTGKPVTQISDGQIQAPTSATGKPVTQISDGQIQAPTGGATKAANGTVVAGAATASSVVAYTGAAAIPTFAAEMVLAAGAFAVAFL